MTEIFVRLQVTGWHRWAGAPPHRAYLGQRHRHRFGVEVRTPVTHGDREIEFHDLMDAARDVLDGLAPGGEFGGMSCEHIAAALGAGLAAGFGRRVEVTVDEDGECGATVTSPAPDNS